MDRATFKAAYRCSRSMRRLFAEPGIDMSALRLCLSGLSAQFLAFKAEGINPFDTIAHQSGEWIAGFVSPQFRREVWGRRRDWRVITGRRVASLPLPR